VGDIEEAALQFLNELIAKGVDFPEAIYKATDNYGVDFYALRDMYDAQNKE
jgi:hypothetical protein